MMGGGTAGTVGGYGGAGSSMVAGGTGAGSQSGLYSAGRRGLFEIFFPEGGVEYVRTPMFRGSARKLLSKSSTETLNISEEKRLLSTQAGVTLDYLVGIRSKDRLAMMAGNMHRMGSGDLAMTQAFLMTLDQNLVMKGRPRENLQANDVGFAPPIVKTVEDATTTPAPTTPDPNEDGDQTTTTTTPAPASALGDALNALGSTDPSELTKNPIALGAGGIVFISIIWFLSGKMRRSRGSDYGSHDSSTTASGGGHSPKGGFDLKLKNYRSQSASYARKTGPGDSWQLSDVGPSRGRSHSRSRSKNRNNRRDRSPSSSGSDSDSSSSGSASSGSSGSS
jgi:hypothetical protein